MNENTQLVYVSGPYTGGDPCINTKNAIEAGNRILDAGHAVFIPHLSHFWHTATPRHYEDWMRIDLCLVPRCDVILRLPGDSPGADREVDLAKSHGIPVYHDIDQLVRHLGDVPT